MKVTFRSLQIPSATLVANEFIDGYMPKANGEYVKGYLYLLRHSNENISAECAAGDLCLTEGDIWRMVSYWEKEGMITVDRSERGQTEKIKETGYAKAGIKEAGPGETEAREAEIKRAEEQAEEKTEEKTEGKEKKSGETETKKTDETGRKEIQSAETEPERTGQEEPEPDTEEEPTAEEDLFRDRIPDKSRIDIFKLKDDAEFTTLLYVVQRYLSRIFSQTDNETIAYLYDVLKMPPELIEYLAELCADRGKTSLRYLQSIALDWHRKGICSIEQAKADSGIYTGEIYGVMKAFGLTGRNPGVSEQEMIRKWFKSYGFSKEIVLEACSRTMAATQKPSFQYTDSILKKWKEAGVRTMEDIRKLDREHEDRSQAKNTAQTSLQKNGTRFSNFTQRSDDLDSLVMDQLNRKLKES